MDGATRALRASPPDGSCLAEVPVNVGSDSSCGLPFSVPYWLTISACAGADASPPCLFFGQRHLRGEYIDETSAQWQLADASFVDTDDGGRSPVWRGVLAARAARRDCDASDCEVDFSATVSACAQFSTFPCE
jgi:hypothetical protein